VFQAGTLFAWDEVYHRVTEVAYAFTGCAGVEKARDTALSTAPFPVVRRDVLGEWGFGYFLNREAKILRTVILKRVALFQSKQFHPKPHCQ
jgi:hypothetical protein